MAVWVVERLKLAEPLLRHSSAWDRACRNYHRGHTRFRLDAHPLLDGSRRRWMAREPATIPSTVSPTPRRCGHRTQGGKPTPGSQTRPSSPTTAITLSSPIGMERPWNWRPTIAATSEIENAIRDLKYARGAQPSPLGPLPRQRRSALGCPGHRPQLGPLDRAHRSRS